MGTGTQGTSETGMGEESGTGETGALEGCAACGPDEACVAIPVSDACLLPGTYDLLYVPFDEEVCATDEGICAEPCVDALCGPTHTCVPDCEYVEGVDIWCAPTGFPEECDPLVQDCPEGEKCVPYVQTPGSTSWDANKCVPVLGEAAAGEPCHSDGLELATDDCDMDSVCFDVDEQGVGICRGFCDPQYACPEGESCIVANDQVITLCYQSCLPFDPSTCAEDQLCLWGGSDFHCFGLEPVEPYGECDDIGEHCPSGQRCEFGSLLEGCAVESCCTDYCDLSLPEDPCPAPLGCESLGWEAYPDVGSCRLPAP